AAVRLLAVGPPGRRGAAGRRPRRGLLPLLPRRGPPRGLEPLAGERAREPADLQVLRTAAGNPPDACLPRAGRRQASVPQGGGLQVRGLVPSRPPARERVVQ